MLLSDPDYWPDAIAAARADVAVIALGTTIRAVGGDRDAFRAVDHDLVLTCARAAREAGVRQLIVAVIPTHLFAAVAGGIGLFIGFIGLRNAGIIVANPATLVALGDLTQPGAILALFGLALIGALSVWNVRGAMLIGIVATTAVAWIAGQVVMKPEPYSLSALTGTAFKLDLPGVFGLTGSHGLGLLEILFVFLFVDLFDNLGTLVAVTKRAGLMDAAGKIPGLNRILVTDAVAT
ncbi:hypothetical protein LTR94_029707, partial [Friedmanniomyces endolithicus]